MNALARFEAMMESVVERPFARLLRTRMQPIEVAKRLSREMEAQRTVAINQVLVPNRFMVTLSADDFNHFAPIQTMLQREMATYLIEYAAEHSYTMPGEALVTFERDDTLRAGALKIGARMDQPEQEAGTAPLQPTRVMPAADMPAVKPRQAPDRRARIEMEGSSCYLDREVITMGRGLDNDVVVEDRRVSRHHARLQRSPRGWEVADLSSTNGTFVNGRPVKQRMVDHGDKISLGGLEMTFFLDAPKR